MFSQSHIQARAADRAMIEEATARFLAGGGATANEAPGSTSVRDGKQLMRAFKDTPPKAVEPKKQRNPESYRESVKKATFARASAKRKAREQLAMKAAVHAGLGDSMSKTAAELGVDRGTLRKACAEHNIQFHTQAD